MELQELNDLLEKPDSLQKAVTSAKPSSDIKVEQIKKQYDPKQHDITDTAKRPDKVIATDQGTSVATVARIPIAMQKRIVRLAAAFLCGNPIELSANAEGDQEKNLLAVISKTWKDNKLDYKSKSLAKMMMAEMECAELWYTENAEEGFWKGTANDKPKVKYKLRMKMLADSLGDGLYPVFNAAGDMIAFGRGYSVTIEGKKTERLDVYTAEKFHYLVRGQNGWQLEKSETNIVGKIPVIYYKQDAPEWYDVQEMIDRLEKLISNHGDTNDYHMSPTIKVKGQVKGFAKKGEQGKIIELDGADADANYMSWDKSPESLKLEIENLMNLIHSLTDTPNISFEQMKGLGTFSGIALKMLFLGAHMKASDKEEIFGESIQRRINYIKAAMGVINVDFEKSTTLTIEPKFTYFLPKNDLEMVEMLTTATSAEKPIMSSETAVRLNPLVQDADKEIEKIKAEKDAADEAPGGMDNEFNNQ